MIKTNIKMRVTPEQSRKVQKICFENGIVWGDKTDKIYIPDYENICLLIRNYITCHHLGDHSEFKDEEIDADLFIRTNGSCKESIREKEQSYYKSAIQYYNNVVEKIMDEETYLTKYTSQPKDLESALKKIENLHIALKKKVERNKNQALEITKLLEQKKDLANNYKMVECERNHFMLKSSEHELKINELENLLKEKDIIISYLRSELK